MTSRRIPLRVRERGPGADPVRHEFRPQRATHPQRSTYAGAYSPGGCQVAVDRDRHALSAELFGAGDSFVHNGVAPDAPLLTAADEQASRQVADVLRDAAVGYVIVQRDQQAAVLIARSRQDVVLIDNMLPYVADLSVIHLAGIRRLIAVRQAPNVEVLGRRPAPDSPSRTPCWGPRSTCGSPSWSPRHATRQST